MSPFVCKGEVLHVNVQINEPICVLRRSVHVNVQINEPICVLRRSVPQIVC